MGSTPSPVAYTGGFTVLSDPWLLSWALGLFAMHLLLQAGLGAVDTPLRAKPGVAAHQIVCFVPFAYAAYMGVILWLLDDSIAAMHTGTYIDRLYPAGDAESLPWKLSRFMLGFQVYDLAATALEPSLRKAEHIAHHSSTLLTAYCAATTGGPFFGYYAAFFFGFTELSSVPLAFVDLFRQIPTLAKQYPAVNELSRTTFAVSFLIIRVVWFPIVMISRWWPDLYAAYAADDVRCSWAAFGWMFFSSAFLTFLQLFWGFKIIRVVLKGNLGGKDQSAAKSETD